MTRRALLTALLTLPVAAHAKDAMAAVMAAASVRESARFVEEKDIPEIEGGSPRAAPCPGARPTGWKSAPPSASGTPAGRGRPPVLERPDRTHQDIALDTAPEIRPLVEAIPRDVGRDAPTLRRYFSIDFSGDLARWRMVLTPPGSRTRRRAAHRAGRRGQRGAGGGDAGARGAQPDDGDAVAMMELGRRMERSAASLQTSPRDPNGIPLQGRRSPQVPCTGWPGLASPTARVPGTTPGTLPAMCMAAAILRKSAAPDAGHWCPGPFAFGGRSGGGKALSGSTARRHGPRPDGATPFRPCSRP